ncbi:MAG: carboxypeptidase regulatory-like domain-containing protein [Planctomycetes bacterium]|nr:carboxypeptidase regulatory-like domain-containing protein [Planctomycetota bacterium]
MSSRNTLLAVLILLLAGLAAILLLDPFGSGPHDGAPAPVDVTDRFDPRSADATRRADAEAAADDTLGQRHAVGAIESPTPPTGVRGVVLDARTLRPLAGVQVAAMREPPTVERFISRIRSAFIDGAGLMTETSRPAELLAKTTTAPDGSFELTGLAPGLVFLDARADFAFVRNPPQVRIAAGEMRDGFELLASPGGRVAGRVRGPDGQPLEGAVVSLRPGLNAFLGQLTQKRYRWLEARTDADGIYDLAGVPTGSGYVLSAGGPGMALEEMFGLEVREGQVTVCDVDGHPGARVAGRVLGAGGAPFASANVAIVYLDVSRVLFSADGRAEPITTDADGRFALDHVAAGRIGLIAMADGLAPSQILDLTVVDDGVYEDLQLQLAGGARFEGLVVDDLDRPVANALVELRPMERPRDPDIVKMVLQVREIDVRTGGDGRFVAEGVEGERLFLQVSKPGHVTEVRFGIETHAPEAQPLKITLTRGVTVHGRVVAADGQPITRFAVQTRSREVDPETGQEVRRERRRGPPWQQSGGTRLQAGQRMGEMRPGDRWKELRSADGTFTLDGLPPGSVRVQVRADGYRDPDSQTVVLLAGAESEVLSFALAPGAIARGRVVDAATGTPVPDALVTAYRAREQDRDGGGDNGGGNGGFGEMFSGRIDPEDFDLLGFAEGSRRSDRTDSLGQFEIDGLADGTYRFTARHPDLAKASAQDVAISAERATDGIVIEIDAGGAVEGTVTGRGGQPLADALIVALSIQAGSLESASTDRLGHYRIEGLAPGQYVVFKSRMDERATNLGYDLLGNMRLKTVGVRRGQTTTLDIQDESEDGVLIQGRVLDGGQPVSRAMVTALGEDRDGLFGMGIRAQPTKDDGSFELVLSPGTYFFQVTRFAARPQQASLSVDVPYDVRQMRLDLELPRSYVAGRVVDAQGNPVPRVRVSAGVEEGSSDLADAPGLLGVILQNGINQTRTGEDGTFRLDSVSAGTYRIAATGRAFGRGSNAEFGDAALTGIVVDGQTPIDNLEIVLPRAGTIEGTVVDGSGQPVRGAEIVATRADGADTSLGAEEQLRDLFGVQARPVRSDADGRFTLSGVTPGTYRVRADADGLAPGVADDVVVRSEQSVPIQLQVVRGATLKLRARNIDGTDIPLADITVLDGQGRPIASRISAAAIFRRVLGSRDREADTGWRTIGNVPPDTYTVIVREAGQPELRVTREIKDGEVIEWDVDVAAERQRAGR